MQSPKMDIIVGLTGSTARRKTLSGMIEGQDARVLIDLARAGAAHNRPVLHIAADDTRMQALQDLIAFFAPDVRVITLPGWDCLPYDRVSPSHDVVAARMSALFALTNQKKENVIILTTIAAATQRVITPDVLAQHVLVVRTGERIAERTMMEYLVRNGYARTDTVRDSGEFAVRGGIIDFYPPGFTNPFRIDLFGDVVESIKSFDPLSQRTNASVDVVGLLPATEYGLDEDSIARFRGAYRDAFGVPGVDDVLYHTISEGRRYQGADHWLPFFHEKLATIFDYVPDDAVITLDPQADHDVIERFDQIDDYYGSRVALLRAHRESKNKHDLAPSYRPVPPVKLYVVRDEWRDVLSVRDVTAFQGFLSENSSPPEKGSQEEVVRARDFADVRAIPGGDVFGAVVAYLATLRGSGKHRRLLIACYSIGSRDRIAALLTDAGLQAIALCDGFTASERLHPNQTALVVLPLAHGFITDDLAVITEQDILGDRLVHTRAKRKKADHFIKEISSLNPGDLVVHTDHGIGRFEGLETIRAAGVMHDCLKLTYDAGDRLYLPVENMDLLSRFGSEGDGVVALDRLGGAGWQARKAKVKKDLMVMAGDLLKIAAERLMKPGETFVPDGHGYSEFVARFPYVETDDQQNAINDVLADLSRGSPADRLVCGDVGFGKTEIALRAAYVAASNGAQVAVVVPTTLLSRQHYHNFAARFAGMGLNVGQISRMVPLDERKRVKQGIADGSIHIVVGTHAILAKDIKFANLGLMIVDEEQRFGVKQKEALKELKTDVHVVTLTATPIPRTLQMALTGVRDMSIIASAPVDRLAIRTSVLPFDSMVVREAILRERHRGGQTFYVCPRISDMADVAHRLAELVPEVRVVMAHGQLTPTELETRMGAFYDRQYDVLLATNIIESGIDIPTANTMIVHRSDMFGLAQLYQIRGRIGRAKVRAYAYLTYDPHIKLNAQAQKRLEVIEMLDTLGSGFQLAAHDLDIRGAGNLLGDDQSGHVREVGVELYQQMLEDAVAAARMRSGETARDKAAAISGSDDAWTPMINLGTSVLIPETYVTDLSVRMSLYRRLSDVHTTDEVQGFAAEMIDRFGPLPPEVSNLIDIIDLKHLCRAGGIDRVDAGPKGAVMGFRNNMPPNPERLFKWLTDKKGTVKLRPDQKISIVREWDDASVRVKAVRGILSELVGVAGKP